MGFLISFGFGTMVILYAILEVPYSAIVVIDESSQIVSLEEHYLLRGEEKVQIPTEEIDCVKYVYYLSKGLYDVSSAHLYIIKLDGVEIEIGWIQNNKDSKKIAEAMGKEFIIEEIT